MQTYNKSLALAPDCHAIFNVTERELKLKTSEGLLTLRPTFYNFRVDTKNMMNVLDYTGSSRIPQTWTSACHASLSFFSYVSFIWRQNQLSYEGDADCVLHLRRLLSSISRMYDADQSEIIQHYPTVRRWLSDRRLAPLPWNASDLIANLEARPYLDVKHN